jgi:hypothetical protein
MFGRHSLIFLFRTAAGVVKDDLHQHRRTEHGVFRVGGEQLRGDVIRGVTREVEFQDTSEEGIARPRRDTVHELEVMSITSTYPLFRAFSTKSHFDPFIDMIS